MTKLPLITARHVAIDALALSPSLMGIPFFSWPRERRLVFLAIGGCFALSVYILLGHIENLPLLVAAAIYMEYPPPGKGVGCRADSLPGLKFISNESAITHASVGLGADGTLQAGHAYAFIFIRPDSGCHKSLPRIETIWQRCQQQKKCHIILLSTAPPEELEKYRKINLGKHKRISAPLTVPLACDEEGEATKRFMRKHGGFVLPHAFVVGPDGVIAWHGHTNRTQFVGSLSAAITKLEPPPPSKKD